jgi:hypothetical protein
MFEEKVRELYGKLERDGRLSQFDADELARAMAVQQAQYARPTTVAERYETSGTSPASFVPTTAEGIANAIVVASRAEDVNARRTAAIWGTIASGAIALGIAAFTGGALSGPAAAALLTQVGPLLGQGQE